MQLNRKRKNVNKRDAHVGGRDAPQPPVTPLSKRSGHFSFEVRRKHHHIYVRSFDVWALRVFFFCPRSASFLLFRTDSPFQEEAPQACSPDTRLERPLQCRKSYYHTLLSDNNDVVTFSSGFSFSARSHDKTGCCCCSNSGEGDLCPKIRDGRENIREKRLGSGWKERKGSLNFLSNDNEMKMVWWLKKKK